MDSADFDEHVTKLRKVYVEATPRQRYSIAQQRIERPEHGPNVLVASVSAVEGLARSLAMHRRAQTKAELSALYPKYKWRGPEELVEEYLLAGGLAAAAEYFGGEVWERFRYAVEYRNVLAHECTSLGQDRSPALIEACHTVLHMLAAAAGLKRAGA